MSTEKVVRYTAEQMLQHADYLESPLSAPAYGECMRMASMLRQAAHTEADVAGLVEALRNVLSADGAFDKLAAEKDAKAELARFQP